MGPTNRTSANGVTSTAIQPPGRWNDLRADPRLSVRRANDPLLPAPGLSDFGLRAAVCTASTWGSRCLARAAHRARGPRGARSQRASSATTLPRMASSSRLMVLRTARGLSALFLVEAVDAVMATTASSPHRAASRAARASAGFTCGRGLRRTRVDLRVSPSRIPRAPRR